MSEIVTKEDFWQIILNDTSQFGQITTEDEEFNEISSFVWMVVQNTFVNTENDNYIKSYEDMIGISGEGLTQYQRKVNILYMLSTKNYLALNLIKRCLINLGVSKYEIEHIKDENKLVVHTDRIEADKLVTISTILDGTLPKNIEWLVYNHNIELSWREIHPDLPAHLSGKYDSCTNRSDMLAVDENYKSDLVGDGVWAYPLSSMINGNNLFSTNSAKWKKVYLYLPNMTSAANFANKSSGSDTLKEAYVYTPKLSNGKWMFHEHGNLWRLSGDFRALSIAEEFLCASGICELECDFPSLSNGNKFCITCDWTSSTSKNVPQLNKKSVLRLLDTIPSYTGGSHALGIGIHIDHQTDDEVLAAITDAEAKGWTLTVQWNGTPTTQTATTYGLRKPSIYARVSERELPDGTIVRELDWGHYVTDPTDYEEFCNGEEAYEHFGLQKPTFEE